MTADPRDLHAGFPDATLVLLPELPLGLPLLGLSKDRPSVVSNTGESTPGEPRRRTVTTLLRRRAASSSRVPTSWSPTTSSACSFPAVYVCCNALPTMGFTTFPLVTRPCSPLRANPAAPRASPRCVPALRSFSPVYSSRPDARAPTRREDVTDETVTCHDVHRPSLPPRRCPRRWNGNRNSHALDQDSTSRPCSVPGSVARLAVASSTRPMLPWAWMLPAASPLARRRCRRLPSLSTRRWLRAEGISTSKTAREERRAIGTGERGIDGGGQPESVPPGGIPARGAR